MIFCGQCGLQLGANDRRCPRCGAVVEPEIPGTVPEMTYNDALSQSFAGGTNAGARSMAGTQQYAPTPMAAPNPMYAPQEPQKLVLGGGPQSANAGDATAMIDVAGTRGASYGGFQGPGMGYAGQTQPQGFGQPGPYGQMGQGQPGQFVAPVRRNSGSGGRTLGLLFMLIGVLLVLGSVVLFAVSRTGNGGNTPKPGQTTGPGSAVTTTATSPAGSTTPTVGTTPITQTPAQASDLLQQYYNYISDKNYKAAYGLWKTGAYKQGFNAFRNSFKNTQQASPVIDNSTVFANGTVQMSVTVTAIENGDQGTQSVTYKGFYLVGPQNDGTWKILNASLNKV